MSTTPPTSSRGTYFDPLLPSSLCLKSSAMPLILWRSSVSLRLVVFCLYASLTLCSCAAALVLYASSAALPAAFAFLSAADFSRLSSSLSGAVDSSRSSFLSYTLMRFASLIASSFSALSLAVSRLPFENDSSFISALVCVSLACISLSFAMLSLYSPSSFASICPRPVDVSIVLSSAFASSVLLSVAFSSRVDKYIFSVSLSKVPMLSVADFTCSGENTDTSPQPPLSMSEYFLPLIFLPFSDILSLKEALPLTSPSYWTWDITCGEASFFMSTSLPSEAALFK